MTNPLLVPPPMPKDVFYIPVDKRGYTADQIAARDAEWAGRIEPLLAEIERLRSVMPRWISVTERMPEDGVFVLVACPSGYTTTPWVFTTARQHKAYRGNRWIDHANDGLSDWGMVPTHWMPLLESPAAPTGDSP